MSFRVVCGRRRSASCAASIRRTSGGSSARSSASPRPAKETSSAGTHHGILLLRPTGDGINAFLDLLTRVIESADLAQLAATVAVASAQGLRVRRSG